MIGYVLLGVLLTHLFWVGTILAWFWWWSRDVADTKGILPFPKVRRKW